MGVYLSYSAYWTFHFCFLPPLWCISVTSDVLSPSLFYLYYTEMKQNGIVGWGPSHAVHLTPKHVGRKCDGIDWMKGMFSVCVCVCTYPVLYFVLCMVVNKCWTFGMSQVPRVKFDPGARKEAQIGQGCYIEWCYSDTDSVKGWSSETQGVIQRFGGED